MNKHIEEYLDHYCGLEHPSYAVLLKGQWGCGKSYFIESYQQKSSKKFIYISLYGLKEVGQIDDALFQATYPRLGSKVMGVASKIMASSLKSTVKVDVSSGGTYLKKLLSKTKDSILIFDDLERCTIPLKEVFGYINSFVEHEKRHVIVIADAAKFNPEEYLSIKEKLIGQELEVQLDIKGALESFCSEVNNKKCREFLLSSFDNICSTYKTSKYNNLRTLRKAIQEFQYIFKALPSEARDKNNFLQDLLNTLLVLSLEVRSGSMKEQDIVDFFKARMSLRAEQDDSLAPLVAIRKKYSLPYSPILGEELWQNFFESGIFNKESLEEAVFNSQYFQSLDQESWVRLVHAVDASDEDFESIKNEVQSALDKKEYKHDGIIKHVFGVFLWMADNGLCEETVDEVQTYFEQYVNELANDESLEFEEEERFLSNSAFAGLGFWSKEKEEFQKFCIYLADIRSRLVESSYPAQAKNLLNIMIDDTALFERMLVLSNSEDQKYFRTPILSYMQPKDFMEALDKVNDKRSIGELLERRYEFSDFNKDLLKELSWLSDLKLLLEKEIKQRKGKISGYKYRNILDLAITPAISKLQIIKDDLGND